MSEKKYKVKDPELKLFMVSLQLSKKHLNFIANNIAHFHFLSRSENEAIGAAVKKIQQVKPDFSIDQTLCQEIPFLDMLEEVE